MISRRVFASFLVFLSLFSLSLQASARTVFDDPDFVEESIPRPDGSGWSGVVGLVFAQDGSRGYAYERGGSVWIIDETNPVTSPFIDITEEVLGWRDYGLLGFALDPSFESNGHVYLYYVVDRHHLEHCVEPAAGVGAPVCDGGYNPNTTITVTRAVIGRITRYTAVKPTGDPDFANAVTVDYNSRKVLVGETPQTGFPIIHQSHGTGNLIFGTDGTLLAACGDGASYSSTDTGSAGETAYSEALSDGIIKPKENVGAYRSQLLDSLNGKIIRIDSETGDGVSSNPFFDAANPRSATSRVWALGLRNPYRMVLKPDTGSHDPVDADPGAVYIGDVGWGTWEDMHVANRPGQNFGWPAFEGHDVHTGYWNNSPVNEDASNVLGCNVRFRDLIQQDRVGSASFPNPCGAGNITTFPTFLHSRPTLDWRHGQNLARYPAFDSSNNAVAVTVGQPVPGTSNVLVQGAPFRGNASTGGVWYTGDDFPGDYKNTYFHGEYGAQWIRNFQLDENDNALAVRPFISSAGGVVFLTTHPTEGELYYISWASSLRRVSYAPGGNRPPEAVATASQTFGPAPLVVDFIGDQSSDPEGTALSYLWDFGDGSGPSSAANPQHSFSAPDSNPASYTVTLAVTDSGSPPLDDVDQILVSVNNTPPSVAITSPVDGSYYPMSGDTIYDLTGDISDAEHSAGELSCAWQTVLHHNTHTHADPVDNNCVTQTQISALGCGEETYFFSLHLTVTDGAGLETTKVSTIYPNCSGDEPPQAVDDSASVAVGGQVDIDVAQNDFDASGLDLNSVAIISQPAMGTVQVQQGTGVVTYTSTGAGPGTDHFYYTIADTGGALSNAALVTVIIDDAVSTPTILPGGGTYSGPQLVTLDTATAGATIYYTLDGNDPDPATSAAYAPGSPVLVDTDLTLKAQAYKDGLTASGIASATYAFETVPTLGLIAYWPLDEGTGLVAGDAAGFGRNGAISGATWATGWSGGGLAFDGVNDVVTVPHSPEIAFSITDSYTLAVWVNSTVDQSGWTGVVTKSRNATPWYGLWINSGERWTYGGANIYGGTAEQGWHHVALVQDGSAGTRGLYVDGVLQASGGAINANGPGDLIIGGAGGVNEYFEGVLDEIRIYNRSLDAAEIVTLSGTQPEPQPPVANAGLDQTLTDLDGNGIEPVTLDGSGSSDVDGTVVGYRWTEGATLLAQGSSATVALDFAVGVHSVDLEVTDSSGLTATDTVLITVNPQPPNEAPVANDDSATVFQGLTAVIPILDNDTDDRGLNPASVAIGLLPAAGSIDAIDPVTGAITYTHGGGAATTDSFTYTVFDTDTAESNVATVDLTIAPYTPPTVTITGPTEGEVIADANVVLSWTRSGDEAPYDHVHIQLDSDPYIAMHDLSMFSYDFGPLEAGPHSFQVWLVDPDHVALTNPEASDTVSFEVAVSTPTILPGGGTYSGPQLVTLDTATAGATIYYTLDGNDPDPATSAAYAPGSPVLVDTDLTLKAQAYKDGLTASGIASATYAFETVPTLGLIAYWPLDEGTGLVAGDAAGFGRNGAISGATWATGWSGGGLAFDGVNDVVTVPHSPEIAFSITDSYTLAVWVNSTVDQSGWTGVVTKSRNATPWYGLWINSGERWTYGGANIYGGTAEQGWHHVALVQDGSAGTRGLYVDGVLQASGGAINANGPGDLIIGGAGGVNEYFEGVLDEIRIYNRSLDAAEIVTLSGTQPEPQPPVANAGLDQTLTDLDGNGIEPVTLDGSGSSDVDGTVVGYRWTEGATLLAQGSSATVALDFAVGVHSVDLEVTDSSGLTATDTVLITVNPQPPNEAPVANDDSATVFQGLTAVIPILDNDTDDRGLNPASVAIGLLPAAGSIDAIDPVTGAITYTHGGGAATTDSFTYTVFDTDTAESNVATVDLTIAPYTPPTVTITGPTEGEVIADANVVLSWTRSGDEAPYDHVHIQLDSDPYIAMHDLSMFSYDFGPLEAGPHSFQVWLVDPDHVALTNPEASDTVSFEVAVSTPTILPGGGTYSGPQLVTLDTATAGATIYYTLDGNDPDPATSAAYAPGSPVLVDTDLTLKAQAYKDGLTASGIASATYAFETVPTLGLIAYWPLDEGTGLVAGDAAGFGRNGAISGATWATGWSGGGLAFDGVNDVVTVPHSPEIAFSITDSYTLAVWVNSTVDQSGWTGVVTKSRNATPWYGLWINSGERWTYGGANIYGGTAEQGWHHVAIVQDGSAGTRGLYVDGVLQASGGAINANGPGDLIIGGAGGVNEYFEGVLDEIRIYNRSLDAGEVATLANAAP